jgi:hypothetical protein
VVVESLQSGFLRAHCCSIAWILAFDLLHGT